MPAAEAQGEIDPTRQAALARVGAALNAKWTIERLVGVGGMGCVFAARHRNGSRAAIKLLHPEVSQDIEVRRRFLAEGRIANAIEHPSRVAVIDDDVSDRGEPFLVMELLEGETLEDRLTRSGGKVPAEDVLPVFVPVLDLLAHCHAASILHRDIKPANVFVTKDGHVKVLDFGIARMRDQPSKATQAGTAMGTPSFMSPEQAMGLVDEIDGGVDLFSVGACLYTALSGVWLHEGRTIAESLLFAATRPAPSLAQAKSDLPTAIVAFVDRAIAFERDKRFVDAAAMRDHLADLVAKLKSGRLSAPATPPAGVVVRGNDVIDDDASTKAERRAAVDRLTAIWKLIGVCLSDLRQYGWTHPQATRSFDNAFRQIVDTLRADPNAVQWDVGAGAFLYDEEPIWTPDRMPFDRIPYQLFADGVRKIQLKEGIGEDEFRDLVAIFLRELSTAFSEEDDSVTALWDRRFEHVAYVAIDSFSEGAEDAEELEERCELIVSQTAEVTHIDKDWDELSAQAQALEVALSALLSEASESARSVASDPLARASLGASADLPEPQWRERYVDAFADAYHDGRAHGDLAALEAALAEWTRDQLALHQHAAVFEMSESLLAALTKGRDAAAAQDIERALVRAMFSPQTLGPVLAAVAKDGRSRGDAKAAVDAALVAGLRRALSMLDSDELLGLACDCYDAVPAHELRAVLVDYVKRFAKGREVMLAQAIPKAGRDLGKLLVGLLCGLGYHAGALEGALKSADVAVRLEALTSMPAELAERVNKELASMLADDAPAVRLEALRVAAESGRKPLGPRVVLRIKQPSFHLLTINERKAWLDALVKLNATRGEEVAIELLTGAQVIPTDAVEETRALAAEILASTASKEALAAARRASKKRWWNTSRVRDAAERAQLAIEEALAARPAPAPIGRGRT